jgi:L-malate glycosyltransferase
LPDSHFEMGKQSKRPNGAAPMFATILQGWSRLKNGEAALRAFCILRKQVPDTLLQMFGNDYEIGGPAHRWAIRNGIAEGVTFKGPLPYSELLSNISANVDVVIHPSLNEAFSMTALEALALRKVFIAGEATSGMNEMLDSGASGVLVDVTDHQAIAAEMLRLAQDESYRDRMAQRGYDRASSQYRLGTVMNQYESLYCRILQNRPAAIGALRSAT